MNGNTLFQWVIVCIALAAVAVVFWLLELGNLVNGIAAIAFAFFLLAAFFILFLDSR